MRNLFRKADIFGCQVGFLVNQSQKYQTIPGACGTIMFCVIVILIVLSQMYEVFQKSKIYVESQTQYLSDSGVLTLTQKNFMFAFRFRGQANNIQDNISIQVNSYQDIFIQSTQAFQFTQCTEQQFQNLYFYSSSLKNEMKSINLQEWYCPSSDFTFQIQSQVSNTNFTSITLQLQSQIPSQQLIEILITYLEIDDFNDQPAQGHIYTEQFMYQNIQTQKLIANIYFKQMLVQTDESIFPINDFQEKNYLVTHLEDTRLMLITSPTEIQDNVFFEFHIKASRDRIYTKRSYKKMNEVISFLGGFLKVLHVFFFIVFSTYNSFDLWLKLAKQFFVMHIHESALKNDQDIQNQQIRNKGQTQFRKRQGGNIFAFNNSYEEDQNPQSKEEEQEPDDQNLPTRKKAFINHKKLTIHEFQKKLSYILESSKVLIPQFRYYLTAVSCFYRNTITKNTIIVKTAISIIHEDLDVFRYIKALSDIEKMKSLLLDEQQRQLFEFKEKQDVIVKKNSQGQIICQKGFGLEKQKSIRVIKEPDAADPIHIQLSMYEEVWKILVKLRTQNTKKDLLMNRINTGLVSLLRNDIKELFEQMLTTNTANEKTSLMRQYSRSKIKRGTTKSILDIPEDSKRSKSKSVSTYRKLEETLQNNLQEVELAKISKQIDFEEEVEKEDINLIQIEEDEVKEVKEVVFYEQDDTKDLSLIFDEKGDLIYVANGIRIQFSSDNSFLNEQENQKFTSVVDYIVSIKNESNSGFSQMNVKVETRNVLEINKQIFLGEEEYTRLEQIKMSQKSGSVQRFQVKYKILNACGIILFLIQQFLRFNQIRR